uniref:VQ domain-containing protein n=1 Tax=Leersia perrieri TaxID=77586 RepID=A0A0D9VL59_9ORYZ
MYSCDPESTAPPPHTAFSARSHHPCIGVVSGRPEQYHHHAVGTKLQPSAGGNAAAQQHHQRASTKKRHAAAAPRPSTSSSRRSSTTVVATDVSNFRAMVQELTGFPPAAIFRPLPSRVPVHAAPNPLGAVQHGCGGGGGGAVHGHSSDTSTAAGSGSSPAVQLPPCSPAVGVFDGLPDLGSPEFESWPDLN